MNINSTKYRLPKGKFFEEAIKKDLIVLHFTAGSTASGAFNSWMQQKIQIGTPYILDVDGTVYETFDPKYWAYHLGVTGAAAENHKHDKRSIPIETVNFGPLKLKGDTLYAWPGDYKTKFCNISETSKYVKASYRGFDYYAAFTDAQKAALVELVKQISSTFNIALTLPPVEHRDQFNMDFFKTWTGVAAHQNFRSDKTDPGPALPWELFETTAQ
jgi:N-acetyl-anhydromuramyl-L-alanine amidase AmpD